MTVAEACRRGEVELTEAGIGSPGTDARLLMSHVLTVPPARLPLRYREALSAPAAEAYVGALARRAAREPLAYITGETEFMGLRFRCDPRALVPRPDTETLVRALVHSVTALDLPRPLIADIGTGTGCVGISLARLLPQSRVLLTDVSGDALALAAENVERNGVGDRVEILHGPDLCPIAEAGLCGELAVLGSNPPYIPAADVATLEPEVCRHEPPAALDGGPDGLDAYRRLLAQAAELPALRVVAFEVGIGQAAEVAAMAARALTGWAVETRPDLAGIPRVVTVRRDRGL